MDKLKGYDVDGLLLGNPSFAYRCSAGYTTLKDIGPKISAGLGLKIFFLNLDYAFVPFGDLGNTHRISLTLKF